MGKWRNIVYALVAIISACTTKKEVVFFEVESIRGSQLFSTSEIEKYLDKNGNLYKSQSQYYFDKAVKFEKSLPQKAIYNYKRGLSICPNYEGYEALGSLFLKDGQYANAIKSLSVACSGLFDKPNENTYAELIVASILAFPNSSYYYEIYQMDDFYSKTEQQSIRLTLLTDKRLKTDSSESLYKKISLLMMSEEEKDAFIKSPENFKIFINSIRDTSKSFSIDTKSVNKFSYSKDGWDDDELSEKTLYRYYLKEEQDSVKYWYECNFNHLITVNDSIKAVVYSIDTSATACPREMRHIYHQLATFTNEGKIIDSKVIAYQIADSLATASFNVNKIEMAYVERKWKNPYNKTDFDNTLLQTSSKGKKTYMITDQGKIELLNDQLSANDEFSK